MSTEYIRENLDQWVKDEAFHTIAGACGDLLREVAKLNREAEITRRLSLELYTATTGPAVRRAG